MRVEIKNGSNVLSVFDEEKLVQEINLNDAFGGPTLGVD